VDFIFCSFHFIILFTFSVDPKQPSISDAFSKPAAKKSTKLLSSKDARPLMIDDSDEDMIIAQPGVKSLHDVQCITMLIHLFRDESSEIKAIIF
jgi:hypothetical protein